MNRQQNIEQIKVHQENVVQRQKAITQAALVGDMEYGTGRTASKKSDNV